MYKENPDAAIKLQLAGHKEDNYQLFVEKRETGGQVVFDLTSEVAGINAQVGKSVQFGKLMNLVVLVDLR